MIDINAALTGAKAAYDLVKSGFDARDEALVKSALVDLQNKHIELTSTALALINDLLSIKSSLADTQAENSRLKIKLEQKSAYLLHEIKPGTFCYAFKPTAESVEPEHYLCQPCWDKGVKSVLRYHPQGYYGEHYACVEADKSAHDIYL